jgi:hypothetical protein
VNSAEAGEPGSPQDVSEDRFGLVIGGMGHGEFRYFPVGSELREKRIARSACGIFEIGFLAPRFRCYIFAACVKRQTQFGGQFGDEFFVRVGGLATEFMIEMNDAEYNAEFFSQFDQQEQHRHRIGAARNANAHAIAGLQQAASANRGQKIGAQPFAGAGRSDRSSTHKSPVTNHPLCIPRGILARQNRR